MCYALYNIWCVFGGGFLTIYAAYNYHIDHPMNKVLDYVMGILGTLTIIAQWIPQMYTTYKTKGPGSLSVITLVINAPGSFLNVILQFSANPAGVSVWLPYLFSG